jgi:hypothetical protein
MGSCLIFKNIVKPKTIIINGDRQKNGTRGETD